MHPVEQARADYNQDFDNEIRTLTNTETWLAETLHGSMETEFHFEKDGDYIIGEDGGILDETFDDSIDVATEIAAHSPNMIFELERNIKERGELDDMYGMLNGELPNTMVVVSDFPEQIKNEKEDVGGYNVERQIAMLRVITAKDGKITVLTRSLDGSNRQALEAIYSAMGQPVEEGELLGQRIHRDLDETWQQKLPEILTDAYDNSMEEQTGEKHHAGIKQSPTMNIADTYKFVKAQRELVDWFVQLQLNDPEEAARSRYKFAATAKDRHQKYLAMLNEQPFTGGDVSYFEVVDSKAMDNASDGGSMFREMERAERRAVALGLAFSGCGETVKSESSELFSTDDQLSTSGYGGFSKSDIRGGKCKFKSKVCPECKAKDVMTTVTETHIEGECGCKVKRQAPPPQPVGMATASI